LTKASAQAETLSIAFAKRQPNLFTD
jgi:hypothetical protein